MQLVSKISNLCGPDPPTSQTHRRTDDMQSQYRALHYIVHRAVKTTLAVPTDISAVIVSQEAQLPQRNSASAAHMEGGGG